MSEIVHDPSGTRANRLGIDFISVLGMPPVEHVQLARQFGVGNISIALAPFTANPHGYGAWSLREDPALRADLRAALSSEGIALANGEGFLIRPGSTIADCAGDLDLMAEIGAQRVNILTIDPDVSRSADELGKFTDMAARRGLAVTLEFMAGMAVGSLVSALDIISKVDRPNLTLMLDVMHLARSGGAPADMAQVDLALIGYFQLCDVKTRSVDATYGEEARHNRLELGTGDIPLAELVAAVPDDCPIGLELPMLDRARAGESPEQRLAASVALAKHLLGEV